MLNKIMKIRMDELAIYIGIGLFAFLFGVGLLGVITYVDHDDPVVSVFRLGTLMALIMMCFIPFLFGIFGLAQLFQYQVAFGMTRKRFLCYDVMVSFLWNLIGLLLVCGLYFAEGGILKTFFAPYPEKNIWSMLPLASRCLYLIFIPVLLTALRELLGSLVMRFGNKAFWVIWAFWMLACILPGRISDMVKAGKMPTVFNDLAGRIADIPSPAWGIMGVVLVTVSFLIAWRIIRKQAVAA